MNATFLKRSLVAIGLTALFFSGRYIYVTLYSLIVIYFLGRYATRYACGKLLLQRQLSCDRVFRGEDVEVTLSAHNSSWVPLVHVEYSDEIPLNLALQSPRQATFALAPGEHINFKYTLRTRQRGVHKIGPLQLKINDPWGTQQMQSWVEEYHELLVYPKVLPIQNIGLPSRLPFGEVRTKHRYFEDPARTTGIREYQPGDPLKKMHWKVSARTGVLHTRQFQPTIALETTIFLNLSIDEYAVQHLDYTTEFAIEVAASVAYYLHMQRQIVGLVTNGQDDTLVKVSARKGELQLMKILEALARVQICHSQSFVSCLAHEARLLPWGSTLIIITSEDTPQFVELVITLRRAGYLIVVLLVGNRLHHPSFITTPPLPGLHFYQVRHEGEFNALGGQKPA